MARRKYYGKVSQRREHVPGRWEDRNAQTPGKGPCKRELRWVQEERCVSEVQVIGMESKACGRATSNGDREESPGRHCKPHRSTGIACFRAQMTRTSPSVWNSVKKQEPDRV